MATSYQTTKFPGINFVLKSDYDKAVKKAEILKKALEAIIKHQEKVGGSAFGKMGTTHFIANKALAKHKEIK